MRATERERERASERWRLELRKARGGRRQERARPPFDWHTRWTVSPPSLLLLLLLLPRRGLIQLARSLVYINAAAAPADRLQCARARCESPAPLECVLLGEPLKLRSHSCAQVSALVSQQIVGMKMPAQRKPLPGAFMISSRFFAWLIRARDFGLGLVRLSCWRVAFSSRDELLSHTDERQKWPRAVAAAAASASAAAVAAAACRRQKGGRADSSHASIARTACPRPEPEPEQRRRRLTARACVRAHCVAQFAPTQGAHSGGPRTLPRPQQAVKRGANEPLAAGAQTGAEAPPIIVEAQYCAPSVCVSVRAPVCVGARRAIVVWARGMERERERRIPWARQR